MSIVVVLGTRPEIIKLAPVIRQLDGRVQVIHTGQHYDQGLSDTFFEAFGLGVPQSTVGIGGESRGSQLGLATTALDRHFADAKPDCVIAQGDTNSTTAAALAANSRSIPLVHVEAGLRSFDRAMPEEHNRVITDHLSDLCLAPTTVSEKNLLAEGIDAERIVVTGNTVVDAVEHLLPDEPQRATVLTRHSLEKNRFILSTLHRPENVDDPDRLRSILAQLQQLPLPVLLPVHPRTRAAIDRHDLPGEGGSLRLVDPIGYVDFLSLLAECALVIGDSGGVQEEVSVVKRPMVVVRRSTERPEVLDTFCALTTPDGITTTAERYLSDVDATLAHLADMESPYGRGDAAARTVQAIDAFLGENPGSVE